MKEDNHFVFKLVKFQGEFVWHSHAEEDEMFFVVKGQFDMEFRDKTVTLNENEFLINLNEMIIHPLDKVIIPREKHFMRL